MAEIDGHLAELATPGLSPGEAVRATVRVNYNGTQTSNSFTMQSGLASLGEGAPAEPDPDKLVAFPVSNQMALVLTGDRLLVWSTGLRGKPKSFLGAMPLSGLAGVEHWEGRQRGQARFTLKSGATVDVESSKGEDVAGFVTEIAGLLEPESPSPSAAPPPTALLPQVPASPEPDAIEPPPV